MEKFTIIYFTQDIGVVSGGAAAAILAKLFICPHVADMVTVANMARKTMLTIIANMARMTRIAILARMARSTTTIVIIRKTAIMGRIELKAKN